MAKKTGASTELSNYLSDKREKSNLSQLDLGTQLGFTSAQFVSNWERGISLPSPSCLPKLVSLLKLDKRKLISLILKHQEEVFLAKFKEAEKTPKNTKRLA
ncbi:MAG: helix-turn-helix domain-containing protein [Bdellovibrionales bacterium]